jgi:hypothetical protein
VPCQRSERRNLQSVGIACKYQPGRTQAWLITFDQDDWPTEKVNSLPLLVAWLKTTHNGQGGAPGNNDLETYGMVSCLSIDR